MNVAQIVRKARLACDAIMPGGAVSQLWPDDELIDTVTEANEDLNTALRLTRKKWGLQTISSTTAAFARDGETYDPTVSLAFLSGTTSATMPPDMGEVVKIMATSDPSVRFKPAQYESQYWVEMEQSAKNSDGTFLATPGAQGQDYFYDMVGERTLAWTPPMLSNVAVSLDYTPMKRPLYYSTNGTVDVTLGSTTILGRAGTTWVSDGVYASAGNQRAELIVGANTLDAVSIRLDRDYPTVATLTDDGHATLLSVWPYATVTNAPFILAMAPTLPRVYHRWIARLTAVYMLTKVNPDLSEKYKKGIMDRFTEIVRPSAGIRQIQESPVTDPESSFGGLTDS